MISSRANCKFSFSVQTFYPVLAVYLGPLRPIFFYIRKISTNFSKNLAQRTTSPGYAWTWTSGDNVIDYYNRTCLGPFQNYSRKGSKYKLNCSWISNFSLLKFKTLFHLKIHPDDLLRFETCFYFQKITSDWKMKIQNKISWILEFIEDALFGYHQVCQ